MTYLEALAMEKGTQVQFGSHPQIWTFFHYSKTRDDFAFTRPNGQFLKPIIVLPYQLRNIHKKEAPCSQ
jgi:hypothetical protein